MQGTFTPDLMVAASCVTLWEILGIVDIDRHSIRPAYALSTVRLILTEWVAC